MRPVVHPTPAMTAFAVEMLHQLAMGETRTRTIDGRRILARAESHTWYGADEQKPRVPHKGITLYEGEGEPDAAAQMRTSQAGLDFLAKWEGVILHTYLDVAGIRTIGVGHVILPGESFPASITHAQAMELLAKDVGVAETAVVKLGVELEQHELDALVSLAFNIGAGALAKSTLAKKLKAGDRAGAAAEFMKWDKAGGKVVPGLHNRRLAERSLFLGELAEPATSSSGDDHPHQTTTFDLDSTLGIQRALNAAGASPRLVEDGVAGAKTTAAVKAFQRLHGLTPDAVVGPKTRASLIAAASGP